MSRPPRSPVREVACGLGHSYFRSMRRDRLRRICPWLLALILPGRISAGEGQVDFAEPTPAGWRVEQQGGALADQVRVSPSGQDDNGAVRPLAGSLQPAPGQPAGALTGRLVFMSAGHGWTFDNASKTWVTQRGVGNEMVEDYGNLDQMTLFAYYCFNAGATVIPFRPVGHQTYEVVLDNDAAEVTYRGVWADSTSAIYYGQAGHVPYRYAALAAAETATATYVPNLPVEGEYPVYTWVRHGSDRTSQLYRVLHTGGEARVRIPHDKVGNGWVYLGTYHFRAGASPTEGAVVVSNEQSTPAYGSVVIADAIRFGNGMGSIIPEPGASVSGYPREEEASRYWIAAGLGQGQPASLYDTASDDASDNVGTPPRMAREMNREAAGTNTQRVFVSFHSNAGGGRGVMGLYNNESLFPGTATAHQLRLAQLLGAEINSDLSGIAAPPLEVRWSNRGANVTYARSDYAFGEIRNDTIGGEMDATIVEVAFHDSVDDAHLMRDPKVRSWVARAALQGVIRYMNEFSSAPLVFPPEPPQHVQTRSGPGGEMELRWETPGAGGGNPTGFLVYRSYDGAGFGDPVLVSGAAARSVHLTGLPLDRDLYFRVTASNGGGESMPSEVVGGRWASDAAAPRVLVVNAFDRFDRWLSPRQTPLAGAYHPPGANGTIDRMIPARMNRFDYVVPHGQALHTCGVSFDTCASAAVGSGAVSLSDYAAVIWAAGRESTVDETFSAAEQSALRSYVAAGGALLATGSEIAWDLDRASGPTAGDRAFIGEVLHATLNGDADDRAGTWRFVPAVEGIYDRRPAASFDDGSQGIYFVDTPDVLTPVGPGAQAALQYVGGRGGVAAVQYDGSAGGGRVIYWGFPFETVVDRPARADLMFDSLNFLRALPPVRVAASWRASQEQGFVLRWNSVVGQRYQVQYMESLGDSIWLNMGAEQVAGSLETQFEEAPVGPGRVYRVRWVR